MSGSAWVDVVVVLIAVIAAFSGFRQGAVASALAVLGVLLGAFAGILIVPHVYPHIEGTTLRVAATVAILVGLVVVGEIAGMILGSALRSGIRSPELRAIDSGVGLVLQALAAIVALWLLSIPLTHSGSPIQSAISDSKVFGAVNNALPADLRERADERFNQLAESPVFNGVLRSTNETRVSAPDPTLSRLPVVSHVKPSVVKVEGEAPGCRQALEGSGFVVAPDLVMTNAHVVAGTETLQVQQSDGDTYSARVVLFDSNTDVAVLRVDGIDAAPLDFASQHAAQGDDAIVLGYPQAGPFRVTAVRVRDMRRLPTANIYHDQQVTRSVYTVRGVIRQGNSGGPMINSAGDVLGVVFATAENPADETGYVLTADQVRPVLQRAQDRVQAVSTGACVRE